MKQRLYILIMLLLAMALLYACNDDWGHQSMSGEIITFSAKKQHIITRIGDEVTTFSENTLYNILEEEVTSNSIQAYSGVELADHSIKINHTPLPTFPVNDALNFYGVTLGSDTKVPSINETDRTVSYSGYEDLMYSNNLKGCTSANGRLQMNFKHAMSLLTFEVVKQESNDLDDVFLTGVDVLGTHSSGVFNLTDDMWDYENHSFKPERTFFSSKDNSDWQEVQTIAKGINGEMLIYPNLSNELVSVRISLEGANLVQKEIEFPLYHPVQQEGKDVPYLFEPNKRYKLTIMVLNNDVRIVAILPQVYEWVDVDMDQKDVLENVADIYLGQPVTFGNLMWMDRNLGARSADCQNDWYNSVGHYFQHGRNIPFILDVDVWKKKYGDAKKSISFASHAALASEIPYGVIYTWGKNGEKYTKLIGPRAPKGTTLEALKDTKNPIDYILTDYPVYDKVAKNVGDEGEYGYIQGFALSSENTNWKVWAVNTITDAVSAANEHDENDTFWYDSALGIDKIENHPCPKGWRLPNHWDLYSFMPESSKLFWQDTYNSGDDMRENRTYTDSETGKKVEVLRNYRSWKEESVDGINYEWAYFAGKFMSNTNISNDENYSYPIKSSYGCVYGIKYQGTEKAYRIMVEQRSSSLGNTRMYARISRFNTKATDKFEISEDGKQWNIHQFDWEHPAEYMDIPLCGFMYENGLTDFGTGSIVRISEADTNKGKVGVNWTLYLRADHNGVAVAGNSRRNLGDQIRCVRDITVKE